MTVGQETQYAEQHIDAALEALAFVDQLGTPNARRYMLIELLSQAYDFGFEAGYDTGDRDARDESLTEGN